MSNTIVAPRNAILMASPTKSRAPEEIIADYKGALAHAKGAQYAAETRVDYGNGWFRVRHVDGTISSYRRQRILRFTEVLSESDFDSEAYSRAIAHRQAAKRQSAVTFQPPAQNYWIGTVALWIVTAIAVGVIGFGVIWWIVAARQAHNRTEQAAYEAKLSAARKSAEMAQRHYNSVLRVHETAPESPTPQSQGSFLPDPNSGFKTVLGDLYPGTKLYWRSSHRLYGVVTDIDWGRVEVALADTVSATRRTVRGYAVWQDRSYITQNFVTEK